MRRVTITDVAKRAGVAVGTVSNVLNGAIPVSEARRKRVQKAIDELGFKQNILAQGLRSRRSPLVGLCVPHTKIAYFSALVNAFEEGASGRGFEILQVLSRQDPEREVQRVEALLNYQVSGLIIVPNMSEATFDLIANSGVPVVVVDRETQSYPFDQVTFDNKLAMYEAVKGLIELGHRNILFVVVERNLIVTIQRVSGMHQAISEHKGGVASKILQCGPDEEAFGRLLEAELSRADPPTAIVVSNSRISAWLIRILRRLDVVVPRDVSILAFDEPEWSELVSPTLSVVRQPIDGIARTSWEFLMRRIDDEATEQQREVLRAEIVFRESIAPPRA